MGSRFRGYGVPIAGVLWGVCMGLAALISRIQGFTLPLAIFPMRMFALLAIPGFLVSAAWLLVRLAKQ